MSCMLLLLGPAGARVWAAAISVASLSRSVPSSTSALSSLLAAAISNHSTIINRSNRQQHLLPPPAHSYCPTISPGHGCSALCASALLAPSPPATLTTSLPRRVCPQHLPRNIILQRHTRWNSASCPTMQSPRCPPLPPAPPLFVSRCRRASTWFAPQPRSRLRPADASSSENNS